MNSSLESNKRVLFGGAGSWNLPSLFPQKLFSVKSVFEKALATTKISSFGVQSTSFFLNSPAASVNQIIKERIQ